MAYMLSTLYVVPRPSVRHTGGAVKKWLKLGLCNIHHMVAASLYRVGQLKWGQLTFLLGASPKLNYPYLIWFAINSADWPAPLMHVVIVPEIQSEMSVTNCQKLFSHNQVFKSFVCLLYLANCTHLSRYPTKRHTNSAAVSSRSRRAS